MQVRPQLEAWIAAEDIKENQLVLIGHSMGGLVIRELLATSSKIKDATDHAVTIATPHMGSFVSDGLAAKEPVTVLANAPVVPNPWSDASFSMMSRALHWERFNRPGFSLQTLPKPIIAIVSNSTAGRKNVANNALYVASGLPKYSLPFCANMTKADFPFAERVHCESDGVVTLASQQGRASWDGVCWSPANMQLGFKSDENWKVDFTADTFRTDGFDSWAQSCGGGTNRAGSLCMVRFPGFSQWSCPKSDQAFWRDGSKLKSFFWLGSHWESARNGYDAWAAGNGIEKDVRDKGYVQTADIKVPLASLLVPLIRPVPSISVSAIHETNTVTYKEKLWVWVKFPDLDSAMITRRYFIQCNKGKVAKGLHTNPLQQVAAGIQAQDANYNNGWLLLHRDVWSESGVPTGCELYVVGHKQISFTVDSWQTTSETGDPQPQ